MAQRSVTSILIAVLHVSSACDDPAPIVLGKLQIRAPDAGRPTEHDETAEHAREADAAPHLEREQDFEHD
jgi:hypothetical protein